MLLKWNQVQVVAARLAGREEAASEQLDSHNAAILEHVNRNGRFYLSHTRLRGRFTLRVSLGNPRAGQRHVRGCWNALRDAARSTRGEAD